jgi:hypothetical protein
MDEVQALGDPWAKWTAATDLPLVLAAIDRSREPWRSAEAISLDAGIPLDRVQVVLDRAPDGIIVAPGSGADGCILYSTREHYRRTTGLFRRYLDTLSSS